MSPADPEGRAPLPGRLPALGNEAAPFWEQGRRGRLVLPRCRSCGCYVWYPRSFCPDCHGGDLEWVQASGKGTIYSYTVSYRGSGDWVDHVPYVIAYVELDEGPRVLTNVVGADPQSLRIGQRVTATFEPAGEQRLLRFEPCEE